MKFLKTSVSAILAIIIAFSCCTVAMGSVAYDTYDHLPQVYVTGFGSAKIYFEDDPEQKSLFYPVDTDRILGNLSNIDDYIIKSIKNGEPNLLYTCVYSFLDDSFGMLKLNPDGSMMEGVAVEETSLAYEGDGKYTFYFDSRQNPVDIAPELHEYIQWVKEDTGSEKIELVGSSYGAAIVASYLNEYPDELECIDSILLCVPSLGGISCFGELLSGELNVDPVALKSFVEGQLGMEGIGAFLGILNQVGVLDPILDAMVMPVLREAVFNAVLDFARDAIATIPAMWICVQDEEFEPALRNMFGDDFKNPDHEYAKLIQTAYYYHENIMLKAEELITNTLERYPEMEFSVICKYGSAPIPLSNNGNLMEDGLVALEITSFGATCANYGETLPAGYKQALYPEYNFLSVDGVIDASTGLLPFNTWYIKGLGHSQKNDGYWELVCAILYEDLNVFSDSRYPQFFEVSAEDENQITPLKPVEKAGFFETLINIIKNMILAPIKLIRKILGI